MRTPAAEAQASSNGRGSDISGRRQRPLCSAASTMTRRQRSRRAADASAGRTNERLLTIGTKAATPSAAVALKSVSSTSYSRPLLSRRRTWAQVSGLPPDPLQERVILPGQMERARDNECIVSTRWQPCSP